METIDGYVHFILSCNFPLWKTRNMVTMWYWLIEICKSHKLNNQPTHRSNDRPTRRRVLETSIASYNIFVQTSFGKAKIFHSVCIWNACASLLSLPHCLCIIRQFCQCAMERNETKTNSKTPNWNKLKWTPSKCACLCESILNKLILAVDRMC